MGDGKMTLRSRCKTWLLGEFGGSLVETALTSPVLIILLLGPVELARVAYTGIEVTNAARAGVAYGSQNGGTASDTPGITWAATHDAANVSGLSVSSVSLSYVCSDGSASTGANTDCSNSHIEETVTVKTQATVDPLIHLPGLPTSYTLHGQAVQKCLQ
jgi:Flp pilus assembly protein TadG